MNIKKPLFTKWLLKKKQITAKLRHILLHTQLISLIDYIKEATHSGAYQYVTRKHRQNQVLTPVIPQAIIVTNHRPVQHGGYLVAKLYPQRFQQTNLKIIESAHTPHMPSYRCANRFRIIKVWRHIMISTSTIQRRQSCSRKHMLNRNKRLSLYIAVNDAPLQCRSRCNGLMTASQLITFI